tara:strand:+ start:8460 stop:9230 length:771 start_codon:yes stop_codon:yes gene_type:complete
MIFFPFGVSDGEVVDPDKLAEEFREASRIAGNQTHWQWKKGCFTGKPELLEQGTAVSALYVGVGAKTQSTNAVKMSLTDTATPSVHENMWKVPYNRSLAEVGDGDVSLSWDSPYPELIFVSFSFNYLRQALQDLFPTSTVDETIPNPQVRFVLRLRIDGYDPPGAGIYSVPINSLYRGTGLAAPSASPTVVAVTLLPAGSHTVSAFAGLKPYQGTDSWYKQGDDVSHTGEVPGDGVRVGARYMSVLRFGRGAMMGG